MQTEWQPIDTAPKDGTEILVLSQEWGVFNNTPTRIIKPAKYSSYHGYFVAFPVDFNFQNISPTHWMPLPEFPND